VERRKLTELEHSAAEVNTDRWPSVSLLLPIYNESEVVERLIDADCRPRYPAELLEILVLDDSSDDTTQLARGKSRNTPHKASIFACSGDSTARATKSAIWSTAFSSRGGNSSRFSMRISCRRSTFC
jgi:cellulose synthase/poly-beta-1,6-N-acetylglucosamine synthase-like glycosyltransferase